jgi:transposase
VNQASTAQEINPHDYDLFAGLDVDKRSIAATFVDHGKLMKSLKMPYDPGSLLSYTKKHFENKRVAFVYEAGPTGYRLYDHLTGSGERCLVASPSMIPVKPGSRVKTNRLDSKGLAESLRGGQIKGIRVPSGAYRELRHLTQLRNSYIKQVKATKCRIKALLLFEGLSFPKAPAGSQWSRRVVNELAVLDCSPTVRFKLDRLLESLSFNQEQALKTQGQIRKLCNEDPDISDSIRYLMSIPGIGWIISSNAIARIGDWRQLKNVRELGSFFGLVPTEDSTGDRVRKGSITHAGDPDLRSMLIEGAWSAIRKDAEIAEFYRRIYQRNPKDRAARIAIVAVARKLTSRMYCVLKERRPYINK